MFFRSHSYSWLIIYLQTTRKHIHFFPNNDEIYNGFLFVCLVGFFSFVCVCDFYFFTAYVCFNWYIRTRDLLVKWQFLKEQSADILKDKKEQIFKC